MQLFFYYYSKIDLFLYLYSNLDIYKMLYIIFRQKSKCYKFIVNVFIVFRLELEEERNVFIFQFVVNKKQFKDIEIKILEILLFLEGNILEDESVIKVLDFVKIMFNEIMKKQQVKIKIFRNVWILVFGFVFGF